MVRKSFGDLDKPFSEYKNSKIVILPIPFDATCTWITGSSQGPDAILSASANMELYDIETRQEVYKLGIHTDETIKETKSSDLMVDEVFQRINQHLKSDKFIVSLGGEHSVSIGSFKAHNLNFSDLTIIQLDAHADLRDQYMGSGLNHACVMARAKEFCPIVQVGIRSMSSDETKVLDEERMFYAHDIKNTRDWYKKVSEKIKDHVYLTIDLDVFDPSIMPSTGTPEPAGLDFDDVLNFVKYVIDNHILVGFDVVELCPNKINRSPDFLAAKLIYMILSYRFKSITESGAHSTFFR
ncbi:MAG: agmatinase [Candidatus Aminicenantes bacterium]|nr:agmatinase [Candidatus Aminicenantes bacterium]